MPKQFIILNRKQALQAICLDLQSYETQTMLMAELMRIVYDDPAFVDRDPRRKGLWIKEPGRNKMQYLEGRTLVAHVCDSLQVTPIPLQRLVDISRRVFQAPVKTIAPEATDEVLLQIDTGMEGFTCRYCGNCCCNLDYHREVTEKDIQRWHSEKRSDILRWVAETKNPQSKAVYRIWIEPGTNQFAKTCPFYIRGPTNDQWLCSIETTKPEVCRQYPFTRKHAVMTGCLGFSK